MSCSYLVPSAGANAGERCLATKASVATQTLDVRYDGEAQDHKQQEQDEGDDRKHFHPTWDAGGRGVNLPHSGGAVGISSLHALLCRAL